MKRIIIMFIRNLELKIVVLGKPVVSHVNSNKYDK